ncbi:MAG: glycosyltransferase [Myxococcales bacterium]|nr:glycosyltransferase [Myxococcales bacterium]
MRVAMLSVHSSPIGPLGAEDTGGMSVYIRQLALQLVQHGVSVDIFTRKTSEPSEPIVVLSPTVRLIRIVAGPCAPMPKASQAAIVSAFADNVAAFAQRAGLRYALIHAHYWISGLVGLRLRSLWSAPLAMTFHTVGALKLRWPNAASVPAERLSSEVLLGQTSDRVFATTTAERADLQALWGLPAASVRIAPGGVDLAHFQPSDKSTARRVLGLPGEGRLLLAVGRFVPVKGLEMLAHAFRSAHGDSDVRLYVVGDDPKATAIGKRLLDVAQTDLMAGRLVLPGRVAHADLPRWYNAADCVVVPSYHESFGLVALESLACGTPVLAARTGCMPECITSAAHGTLFRPGDVSDLASTLANWRPPQTDQQQVRGAVASRGWSSAAEHLHGLYEALCSD